MSPDTTSAAPAAAPAIFELLAASRLPRASLERHLATTLVARDASELVGTAALELYGSAALLRSVAVATRLRGRGLGQALTHAALELARRRGARTVYLLTETAGAFFPRFGFKPIARADVEPAVLAPGQVPPAGAGGALVLPR